MSKSTEKHADWSFHEKAGLTPVINVSGTMTALGASIAGDEVQRAMAEILPCFVDMHELQAAASRVIADMTGAEAGFVTASSSAAISLGVAAAITGFEPGSVELLPQISGSENEVVIQLGHLCNYGAPVGQAIELAGADVVGFGQSTHVMDHQLQAAIGENTVAGVFVVSHHVVQYGQMPLKRFAELCHERGLPVIVDAASEYDLEGFLRDGADMVIYSAHKFLGGPTAGIIAGHRDLVRAAYLQNLGIGRGMKVGKESIFGTMAALRAWSRRDHAGIRARENAALALWENAVGDFDGVTARAVADPTGNPLQRLEIRFHRNTSGTSAAGLARALANGSPAIIVRDHEVELGYLLLDACNLAQGHAGIVASQLKTLLKTARDHGLNEPDLNDMRNGAAIGYRNWLEPAPGQ